MSYTTLIEDTTDTFFESGLPTRISLPKRENFETFVKGVVTREHFDNIDVYGIDFKNTAGLTGGSVLPNYRVENTNGVMSIIHTDGVGSPNTYIQVTDAGEVKFKILDSATSITPNPSQTLVPIVVDSTGKVYRGSTLFQNLLTLDDRLSQIESLAQTLRTIHNQSHFTNLTL